MKVFIFIVMNLLMFNSFATPNINVYDLRKKCINKDLIAPLTIINERGMFQEFGVESLDNSSIKTQSAVKQLKNVYHFFDQQFNWKSVDGHNSKVKLLTNLGTSKGRDCDGVNAFFASIQGHHLMIIQFGNPRKTLDIASDVDVIAHEFSHGLFAELRGYSDRKEVRALGESIADMFGVTAKMWYSSEQSLNNINLSSNSFKIGQTFAAIIKTYNRNYSFDALRNMANPYRWNHPGHYSEGEHYRDIHKVGGITNLAFFLLSHGGSHPKIRNNILVNGIGIKKASKIIFYTLKHLATFNSMHDFAIVVKKASRKIYGRNSDEWIATHNAFAAVGLFDSAISKDEQPTQETPTQESAPTQGARPTTNATPSPSTQIQQQPTFTISGESFIYFLIVLIGIMLWFVLRTGKNKSLAPLHQEIKDWDNRVPKYENKNVNQSVNKPVQENLTFIENHQETMLESKLDTPLKEGEIDIVMHVNGEQLPLSIGDIPVVLGRQAEALPTKLQLLFKDDGTISRKHCELWYKKQTNELYIRNLSPNGTQVTGTLLSENNKAKMLFTATFNFCIGETTILLDKIETR